MMRRGIHIQQYRLILYTIARYLFIFYLVLLNFSLFSIFFFPDELTSLGALSMLLLGISTYLYNQKEKPFLYNLIDYCFIAVVIYFILHSIELSILQDFLEPLRYYRYHFYSAIAIFGIASICHKKKIVQHKQNLITLFTIKKQKKKSDKWSWLDKKQLQYLILAIIIITAIGVRLYDLGGKDLREDEFQVVSAAAGYYYTGTFYRWDWVTQQPKCLDHTYHCKYLRAWPHSFLISQVFNIIGISEWSARILSVVAGSIFVFIFYFFTKFFTQSKSISIIATIAIALYPPYLVMSRYTRMYAFLSPLFFILTYFLYRGITEERIPRFLPKKIKYIVSKYVNYHYPIIVLAILTFIASVHIHINAMSILPAFWLFSIYLAFSRKKKKYYIAAGIGTLGLLLVSILPRYSDALSEVFSYISFFGRNNIEYIEYLTRFPFPGITGLVLLICAGLVIFVVTDKNLRDKIVFLNIIVWFTLFFYIYIADRYPSSLYISHVAPIAIIILIAGYGILMSLYKSRVIKTILILLLLFCTIYYFVQSTDYIYGDNHNFGRFSVAYKTILNNIDPEKDIIIGQYLREYYMPDLDKNVPRISMQMNRRYDYNTFIKDIQSHESGWITWESRKKYHIKAKITDYVEKNFEHIHGKGKDKTYVEVYYYNQSMIP